MLKSYVPETDWAEVFAVVRDFFASDKTLFRFDHQLRRPDGQVLEVICRAFAERDADGRVIRVVGTHADISELRRREEEVFRLNRKLEDLLQEQSQQVPPLPPAPFSGGAGPRDSHPDARHCGHVRAVGQDSARCRAALYA